MQQAIEVSEYKGRRTKVVAPAPRGKAFLCLGRVYDDQWAVDSMKAGFS